MSNPTALHTRKPARHIIVNVFPGGFNWPLFAAQDKGFFARNGLTVDVQGTVNSVSQMTGLSECAFDIAITAMDNIVAYAEGQGEAPIGPQPDFFAFMGIDAGFLRLVAGGDVHSMSELRGRTVSVDALTTGYAFVLLDILRRAGLAEGDYGIAKAGGMVQRWCALMDGKHDATLLSAPFNLLATTAGCNQLAQATDIIGPYQGNVGAARRIWAEANRETVSDFIRSCICALDWLHARDNRQEAIQILLKHLPDMTTELAERSYQELLVGPNGFIQNGQMNMEGVRTVLNLRSRYGEPRTLLADAMAYYDPAYYQQALAALHRSGGSSSGSPS